MEETTDTPILTTHLKLYDNIQLLDDILCKVLRRSIGSELLDVITQVAAQARSQHRERKNLEHFVAAVCGRLKNLSGNEILAITRAFAHFLNLTEIAEQYHRIRRRHWHQKENHPPQPGSLEAVLPQLIQNGLKASDLDAAISNLNIELVLTAHPTEVTRRSLIHKYNAIAKNLERLDREDLTPDERERVIEGLEQEITAAWFTEEIRHKKPSAIDEAKWGFAVVEESLWNAVPEFMRDLDKMMLSVLGKRLPIGTVPIRFASWMGGDRDGNPNVTSDITREVTLLARWMAADLYWRDITALGQSLSMNQCSDELRSIVGASKEPYRAILRGVKEKLLRTKQWAECQIEQRELCPSPKLIFMDPQDLLEPLLICYRSLQEIGAEQVAEGSLLDVIRRVTCFGLSLLPVDIRQHAEKHNDLMDFITSALEVGHYKRWTEEERQDFLLKNFINASDASHIDLSMLPIIQDKILSKLPESLQEYANTFKIISLQPRDSFGSYVISMAARPSDVLVVLVLQKIFGISQPLPIVPLFETLEDLNNAAPCMDALLKIPEYRRICHGSQQVMIGYSDSAKDAGFLAASWAQYQAQEAIVAVGIKYGMQIIFFHGRGGSVGRGGGPAHLAIRSLPPGSTTGKLRVTQQGEVIRHRFGLQKIAERTLAIYCTATLEASLIPERKPEQAWRTMMDHLSRASVESYRAVVNNNPLFGQYFARVTPLQELDKIAMASRPSRRQQGSSIEHLRAIPWVFAWTQNRLILPAWFGSGEAFSQVTPTIDTDLLTRVEKKWSYFSSVLSMIEMGLAKADPEISKQYDHQLAPKALWGLGDILRDSFWNTEKSVLDILQESSLLKNNPILKRSIDVRSPYLLPLHVIQIELLKRGRQQETVTESVIDEALERALLVSITGIAAGMHNTG